MKISTTLLFLFISTLSYCQEIDTLSFYSNAFQTERTVFIHKPELDKYRSELVKLPVIYLLDGQHEWFINPLLSDINYLRVTHEMPNALVVVIPLTDRNKECVFSDLKTELPLDIFITKELDKQLEKYNPNAFKVLIGHSFSASFSLYSYYNHPDYYTYVIAHSPMDEMDLLVKSFDKDETIDKSRISISVGGIASDKDHYHRKNFNRLEKEYPAFFDSIHVFKADYSTHNAVPIAATPTLLSQLFEPFSSRYTNIAFVNENYNLAEIPESPEKEIAKVKAASLIGNSFYPPEIADLNGLASRYWNNGYEDHAIELYLFEIEFYPKYYDFYISLYNLMLEKSPEKAKKYLLKAENLLKTVESNWDGKAELILEIEAEKQKNGWN